MFDNLKKPIPLISLIILVSILIGCKHEYPPFEEYEVVGFVPLDSVMYGILFVNGERLFALCDTTHVQNQWSLLREYDLQDPANPVLQNTEWLSFTPGWVYRDYQDSLVFFGKSYYGMYNLMILNLNTDNVRTLLVEYGIQDLACKDHFLFVSTYNGLRVLDITQLPEYTEVFNDSISRAYAFLELRDTILIDTYYDYQNYRAKFWNVENPENPLLIYDGILPYIGYVSKDIGLTDEHLLLFDYSAIQRYRHDMYDTLIYEEELYISYTPTHQKTSDSLIYLSDPDRIEIIKIDDFESAKITICSDWYYQFLSFEIFEEMIYVLVREEGIYVLQRRAS